METSFRELMAKHGFENPYDIWRVKCRAVHKILGGWPKNSETELAMLEARQRRGLVREETVVALKEKIKAEATADEEQAATEAMEKAWTGFKEDKTGIYIETRQVKACLREVAFTVGLTSNWSWKQVLQHTTFVRGNNWDETWLPAMLAMAEDSPCGEDLELHAGERVYFQRGGKTLTMPEGTEKMIAHIIGQQGPRSTIKFHDFVYPGVEFEFDLMRAASAKTRALFTEKDIVGAFVYMQNNGLGCSRSQNHGWFEVLTMTQTQEGQFLLDPKDGKPKKEPAKKGKKSKNEDEA